jgi:hypothetical protein
MLSKKKLNIGEKMCTRSSAEIGMQFGLKKTFLMVQQR